MKTDHRTVAKFYNEVYYSDIRSVISRKVSWHLKRLATKLNIFPGQALLDVACGDGKWLRVAKGRGAKVVGLDISEKAIEYCRSLMPDGDFHCGPAEKLPFENNSFDIITCLGSLEHFLNQRDALQEMHRVAKPNGRILILVPNADFLTYRLGLFKGTQQREVQETIRPIAEWERLFDSVGLKVVGRWRDLHIFNRHWITRKPAWMIPARLLQAFMLIIWPIKWQYQIHFLCKLSSNSAQSR
ncbi:MULTISPECIES: class I SAM-dependent methyltransferase [unclassified Wenzhouxiangella]|uniref:class I SAM-dependent methyltransferase n=1 Tax=unclassified Wenzhouxiangella TaxID=2613841 RepID=UPI000E32CF81|nr:MULTISPECIES: class I SAM-dependent methyltransferase [unclassified Wenzhouxiangella]RFF27650.1 class I SAM-dependent methyltransferase [Wenzhouxiangella sp. 15181]RFP69743.1 class I SAM-dependent methyltransferase [Wenzhouxiangella sp. 15190]